MPEAKCVAMAGQPACSLKVRRTAGAGVTLIELLVVIAAVGVLGAVLVLLFGGYIGASEDQTNKNELAAVQSAVISMMEANGLAALPRPVVAPTNDMAAFPDTSVCGKGKLRDRDGTLFVAGRDQDGYVLYQHDATADEGTSNLVNYFPRKTTKCWYSVNANGAVMQARDAPAAP